jgi:protein translocase SecG subunit
MSSNQLNIIQIVLAIIVIILIILQSNGASLSATFGGAGGGGESFRSRRGLQKFLLYATIIAVILFVSSTIISLILAKGS